MIVLDVFFFFFTSTFWIINTFSFATDCVGAKTCAECMEARKTTEFHCTWCSTLKQLVHYPVFTPGRNTMRIFEGFGKGQFNSLPWIEP